MPKMDKHISGGFHVRAFVRRVDLMITPLTKALRPRTVVRSLFRGECVFIYSCSDERKNNRHQKNSVCHKTKYEYSPPHPIKLLATALPGSKRREVFLTILGGCYITFHAQLFEDAATLLLGYTKGTTSGSSSTAPFFRRSIQ